MSLARRLIQSYLAVILVALVVIGGALAYLVQTYLVSSTDWQLTSQAQRVALSVAPNLKERAWESLKLQLWTLSYSLDFDIWVLNKDGITVAYAWQDGGEVPLDLISDEVESALQGGTLVKKAVGPEQQGVLVLVPVRGDEREVLGAVALRSRAAGTSRTLWSIMQLLLYASLPAVVLASILGFSLSRRILRPLREMTEAARRLVPADFQPSPDKHEDALYKDEVQELARSFAYAAAQVEETMEEQRRLEALRRQLVADISHEFRGPLTTLRAFFEMEAETDLSPEERKEGMELVKAETLHLSRLVEDLTDLSLLEGGAELLRTSWVNVDAAMKRAASSMRLASEQAGILLEVVTDEIAPALEVHADPIRLQQILRNLLENALHHTPAGGKIELTAEAQHGKDDGDGVWFHVQDNGVGIEADDLPYVWERFYKADKARPRRRKAGSGLGLAIVQRLVELHRGKVAVRSRRGEGSRFSVFLPTTRRAPDGEGGQAEQGRAKKNGIDRTDEVRGGDDAGTHEIHADDRMKVAGS